MTRDPLSELVDSYMITALSFSGDIHSRLDSTHTIADFAPVTRAFMIRDCEKFLIDCQAFICWDPKVTTWVVPVMAQMLGHDLWLSRTKTAEEVFWANGDWPEPAATKLTDYAEKLGNVELYVGDDGRIYA